MDLQGGGSHGPHERRPSSCRRDRDRPAAGLAGKDAAAAPGAQPAAQFYAHLYLGLFAEANGDARRALEHITAAADRRYAGAGGYMHTVAKVHLATLKAR